MEKRERVESLGWLTESSIMPKKQKVIEGVSASSIVQLRAELYETQEEMRRRQNGDITAPKHRSHKKSDVFARTNPGVHTRENRDKLIVKEANDGTASYAALEKKAQIYEKLLKGELPDEEEREKYSVDFLRKGFLEDDKRGEVSDEIEDEGGPSSDYFRPVISETHKQLVKEVNKETVEAREKAAQLKQRRQNLAEKQREKLKQTYLKKKVEQLKKAAAAATAAPSQPQSEN